LPGAFKHVFVDRPLIFTLPLIKDGAPYLSAYAAWIKAQEFNVGALIKRAYVRL
jgi:hypothetical protein